MNAKAVAAGIDKEVPAGDEVILSLFLDVDAKAVLGDVDVWIGLEGEGSVVGDVDKKAVVWGVDAESVIEGVDADVTGENDLMPIIGDDDAEFVVWGVDAESVGGKDAVEEKDVESVMESEDAEVATVEVELSSIYIKE